MILALGAWINQPEPPEVHTASRLGRGRPPGNTKPVACCLRDCSAGSGQPALLRRPTRRFVPPLFGDRFAVDPGGGALFVRPRLTHGPRTHVPADCMHCWSILHACQVWIGLKYRNRNRMEQKEAEKRTNKRTSQGRHVTHVAI